MKTRLDLRPVYHWTDKRIKGHVMMCFLSFLLETSLKRRFQVAEVEVKYSELLDDLKQLLTIEVKHDGKTYISRTQLTGKAYEAFLVMGIRAPNHIQEVI